MRVHHAVPGRTRLRLNSLRGHGDLLAALARRVTAHTSVHAVHENAVTGALLIEHDQTVPAHAIAASVRVIWRHGLAAPAGSAGDEALAPWHALGAQAATAAFQSPLGLSSAEARLRLQRIGENRIADAPGRAPLTVLVDQFKSVPVALLAGSAVLSFATGSVVDAFLALGVIAFNAGIGAATEGWTARLIRQLTRQTEADAIVLRDGVETIVPASRIAPGDWIVLRTGAPVPADARLLHAETLLVDESSLTGESFPAEKYAEAHVAEDAPIGAQHTMVHRGSVVTNGAAVAVVTATGAATEIGRVRTLLDAAQAPKPPMEAALDELGVRLTLACLAASATLGVLLKMRGATWPSVAKSAVALAVSAIPEGLPALAASTKAIAARAMSREGAFIGMNVLESAAHIDVVCFDKTGTLTQNRMQAAIVQTATRRYELPHDAHLDSELHLTAKIAALCNDASLGDAEQSSAGSGTERALLHLASEVGLDVGALRMAYPRAAARLRSEQRLYMATEHTDGDTQFLAVKGAPHQVLALCANAHVKGDAQPLSSEMRAAIAAANEALSSEGLRVLGIARGDGRLGSEPLSGLEWLGLVGLRDPLRVGARATVNTLQQAGLRTLILTGDQAGTARRLAEDLGFCEDGHLNVVDASVLHTLSPSELGQVTRESEVFARVSPADKLALIRALQADGHVVAMTGDGVNDGPALRAADVGIAMGKSGADVARDVADIVIADDDLSALATALARGRTADDNLRRAVRFLLSTNASEVALVLVEALEGPDALETPAQLFWLNLMSDVFPSLGLAIARPSTGVMLRPPRRDGAFAFGGETLRATLCDALKIVWPALVTHTLSTLQRGAGARTRGLTFLALGVHQLMHALRLRAETSMRDLTDRSVELGVAAAFALLTLPFALPPLQRTLRIAPPRTLEAGLIVTFAVLPFTLRLLERRENGGKRAP